jgi:hypothetical protein
MCKTIIFKQTFYFKQDLIEPGVTGSISGPRSTTRCILELRIKLNKFRKLNLNLINQILCSIKYIDYYITISSLSLDNRCPTKKEQPQPKQQYGIYFIYL